MARNPKAWMAIAVTLALVIFANYKYQTAKELDRVAAEASLRKAAQAQTMQHAKEKAKTDAAALQVKCTVGLQDLLVSTRNEAKAGRYEPALMLLLPCESADLDKPSKDKVQRAIASVKADQAREVITKAAKASAAKKSVGVSIGASKQDVYDSAWGRPQKVNTTTNAYGTREQWVYGGSNYLYFRNGVLESIQN